MKKIFTIIALASISFASAQITTNAGTFNKPASGDIAFEVQFMPNLDGTATFDESSYGTLMIRSFKSDTKALRYFASLEVADTGLEGSNTAFDVRVGIGAENHFSGAERLSTFWGYQGNLGYADLGIDDVDGIFSIGAGLFLGAEYYIVPKVYIGTEIGWGLNVASAEDTSWGLSGNVTGLFRLGVRL